MSDTKTVTFQNDGTLSDCTAVDKKKIIGLIDLLAKTNEEKEIYSKELISCKSELESYETKISKMHAAHQKDIQKLNKQINELKSFTTRTQQCKEAEITILKTEKEIELKKLKYDQALKLQELEMRSKLDLQTLKNEKESEMLALQNQIKALTGEIDSKVAPLVEKDKLSKRIIDMLRKEKTEHEQKIVNCKNKLRMAIEAIQQLKQKLDALECKRNNVQSQATQTCEAFDLELYRTQKQRPGIPDGKYFKQSIQDHAVMSELFFTADPLPAILDPIFFNNSPFNENELNRSVPQ